MSKSVRDNGNPFANVPESAIFGSKDNAPKIQQQKTDNPFSQVPESIIKKKVNGEPSKQPSDTPTPDIPIVPLDSEAPLPSQKEKITTQFNNDPFSPAQYIKPESGTEPKPLTDEEKLHAEANNIIGNQKVRQDAVIDYGNKFGIQVNPDEILNSADKSAAFLQRLKEGRSINLVNQLEAQKKQAESQAEHPQANYDFGIENAFDPNSYANKSLEQVKQIQTHVIDKTIDEGREKGLSEDEIKHNLFKNIDPQGYARNKEAVDSRSTIGVSSFLSGSPFLKDSEKQFELLNTQKAPVDFAYNEGLKRMANDRIVVGTLNNDEAMVNDGKALAAKIKTDDEIYSQYPSLNKARIAADISKELASRSGQLEGTDAETLTGNVQKFTGQGDALNTEAFKQYYANPSTRELALDVAANPENYLSDASFLGGIKSNIAKPFKELWLSGGDILGLRDKMDRLTDTKKEELFPEQTPEIRGYVSKIRGAVNTTAYLTGMMALQIPGTAAGTALGFAEKGATRIGTGMAFGIPSFDANLKDADNFIKNDAGKAAYATLGAMINTAGGEFLELGKISKFKELQSPLVDLANKITDKNITQDAVSELLDKAKIPYIDALTKYGTNVTKGAATMSYFTFANGVNKMLFGGNEGVPDLVQHTGTAFLDGLLGMSVLGAFGAHADLQKEKNTTYKNNIFQLANNQDAARDVIETAYKNGQYTTPQYNEKIAILNTAVAAKDNLKAIQQNNNAQLDEGQKAVYVTNRTAEGVIKKQLESPLLTPEQKTNYEEQLKRLQTQREDIFKGLKFSDNLEPLTQIFDAQKEYNRAYEDFNNGVVDNDTRVLEAKKNLEDVTNAYNKGTAPEVKPETFNIDGKPATRAEVEDILSIGQKEADLHDINYSGNDQELHKQLQGVGGTTKDEVTTSPKSRETVLNEGVNDLYDKLDGKAPAHFLDPLNKQGSIEELSNQALTTPNSIKNALKDEPLTVELIARNTAEDINNEIDKWQKVADKTGENVNPQEAKDAKAHIDLLKKGLEEKAKVHEASTVSESNPASTVSSGISDEVGRRLNEEFDLSHNELEKLNSYFNSFEDQSRAEDKLNAILKFKNEIGVSDNGKEISNPLSRMPIKAPFARNKEGIAKDWDMILVTSAFQNSSFSPLSFGILLSKVKNKTPRMQYLINLFLGNEQLFEKKQRGYQIDEMVALNEARNSKPIGDYSSFIKATDYTTKDFLKDLDLEEKQVRKSAKSEEQVDNFINYKNKLIELSKSYKNIVTPKLENKEPSTVLGKEVGSGVGGDVIDEKLVKSRVKRIAKSLNVDEQRSQQIHDIALKAKDYEDFKKRVSDLIGDNTVNENRIAEQYDDIRNEAKSEYEKELERNLEDLRAAYTDATLADAALKKINETSPKSVRGFIKRLLTGATPESVAANKARLVEMQRKYRKEKADMRTMLPRERGANFVVEKLSRAARNGDISQESADLAIDLIRKQPEMFGDLAISITGKKGENDGVQGWYRAADALVKIFKNPSDETTVAHEVLHHTERFLPHEIRDKIIAEWNNEVNLQIADIQKKLKTETNADTRQQLTQGLLYLGLAQERQVEPNQANVEAMERIMSKYLGDHTDSQGNFHKGLGNSWYQLYNPSEWWAVNASRLFREAKNKPELKTWTDKAKAFYNYLIEAVKRVFKGSPTAAVEKGLKAVLNGETLEDREGNQLSASKKLLNIKQKGSFEDRLKSIYDEVNKGKEQSLPTQEVKAEQTTNEAENKISNPKEKEGIANQEPPENPPTAGEGTGGGKEPPKEGVKAEGEDESGKNIFKNKSILNRLLNADNIPESTKERLREEGLKYKPQTMDEAEKIAKAMIDEYGIDNAVTLAESNKFKGGINTAIFGESLNRLFKQEIDAKNPQDKLDLAKKSAEIMIRFDEAKREQGRDISQIQQFYKKSPLGVKIAEETRRKEAFDDFAKNKNKSWKEFFDEMKKEPEFEKLFKETVKEELKKERAESRKARKEKIDDIFNKAKDEFKGGAAYFTIIPPKLITAAIDGMQKAYHAGEKVVELVQDAIDYISSELGTSWDKEKFRKEWEEKLKDKVSDAELYKEKLRNQIKDLNEQITERKRKPKKDKKQYDEETTNLIKERDEKRKLLDEVVPKKTEEELSAEKRQKLLDRFRSKLKGLSEKEKDEVIRKSFKKLVENGALEYDDFKKIISDTLGYGELTPEESKKITDLVSEINKVDELAVKLRDSERNTTALKEYQDARKKAEKSATELGKIVFNRPDVLKRVLSIMQLNTLGIPSLINNPLFNVFNQITVRLPRSVIMSAIDQAIYGVGKAFDKNIKPENNVLTAQSEFYKKLAQGSSQSIEQLFTGLTNKDYFQKEVYASQIHPVTSLKELWQFSKGTLKLSNQQVADKALQATVGVPAEIIARVLNIGDKPQRYAAEGAQAAVFAKNLGLQGIDYKLFMEFPKEEAYRKLKKDGLSDEAAMKRAEEIQQRIISEGEESTFQQDNLLNDALTAFIKPFGKGGEIVKTFNMPFVKIPLNAFWSVYNLANPEVALLQSMIYGSKATYAKFTGKEINPMDIQNSKKWFAHAVTGLGLLAVTGALAKAGIINSPNQDNTTKKEREGELYYEQQNSINMSKLMAQIEGEDPNKVKNGLNVDLKWLGNLGVIMGYQAQKLDNLTPEQRQKGIDFMDDMVANLGITALDFMDKGVFSNSGSFITAITKGGPFLDNYLINLINMGGNVIQPAAFAQISRAQLPYYSKSKADSFGAELKNDLLVRSSVLRKLSGELPPSKIGLWGDKLDKKDNVIMRLFGISHANDDNFAQPIYEDYKRSHNTKFFPSAVKPEIKENGQTVKLNAEQASKLETLVGQNRKALVAPYVNNMATFEGSDKTYGQLSEEDKLDKLNILYEQGYQAGKTQFFQLYPLLKPKELSESEKEIMSNKKESNKEFRSAQKEKINDKINENATY